MAGSTARGLDRHVVGKIQPSGGQVTHTHTPFQILKHLNTIWCPLDVQAKKNLKNAYFTKWDGNEHLTAFGKRLDDNQNMLIQLDITISDEDKLQFYLEQI